MEITTKETYTFKTFDNQGEQVGIVSVKALDSWEACSQLLKAGVHDFDLVEDRVALKAA